MANEIIFQSLHTCPKCNHRLEETMPSDACQFFYECEQCKTMLKLIKGECFVYYSYGFIPCPSIQQSKSCC